MSAEKIVATFEDKYGETKKIHKDRRGRLLVKRENTPILVLSDACAVLIGHKIKAARMAAGFELAELAARIGVRNGHPKNRMWEIENHHVTTRGGIRMGTLYAIAAALDIPITDLLPTKAEVLSRAGISTVTVKTLGLERALALRGEDEIK